MKDAVLETLELGYHYPDGRAALSDLTLQIRRGERVALLGANGSGKTTLLLNLLGLLVPTSGEIRAFSELVRRNPADLKRLRSRVGLVFQNPDSQLLSASVAEDVSFGPMNLGLPHEEVRARVADALAAVGMGDHADVPAHALSFGQKKRVCIAGVLAMHPEVLLLDEPTAGLDARAFEELLAVLGSLHAEGMTVVLSTHDIDLAYAWADRAEVLDRGRLVDSCVAREFSSAFPTFTRHGLAHPRVAEIYHAARDAQLVAPSSAEPRTHAELLATLSSDSAPHEETSDNAEEAS
ncbi:MAG: ABC transporter ATP-binding protein [Coriobacteriia bacterium]|nr:ABC transporter ATP-binding protein [Coriobacteriia bacterium]